MKLILIYGPPAVGKLTVAQELSKLTGYKLFHNHLVADLVTSVFEFETTQFTDLSMEFKYKIVEEAAKSNTSLIMTLVYGVETIKGSREDEFIKGLIARVERYGGEIVFVKLTCSKEEQLKRLGDESRKMFKKIKDPEVLKKVEAACKLDEKIAFVDSLVIDNTNLSAEDTAQKIYEKKAR